jgi:hypothetical protein
MYVCMYICICACVRADANVFVHACLANYQNIIFEAYRCKPIYVLCVLVQTYIPTRIHTYIHTYTHTYIKPAESLACMSANAIHIHTYKNSREAQQGEHSAYIHQFLHSGNTVSTFTNVCIRGTQFLHSPRGTQCTHSPDSF